MISSPSTYLCNSMHMQHFPEEHIFSDDCVIIFNPFLIMATLLPLYVLTTYVPKRGKKIQDWDANLS